MATNSARYPSKTFSSSVVAYFHAESSSDIYSSAEAKYWYELTPANNGTKRFVLLTSKAIAQNFFSNPANLTL